MPHRGESIDPDRWEKMLDGYYHLQNWDVETGWQTENGLKELNLEQVADQIRRADRLPG